MNPRCLAVTALLISAPASHADEARTLDEVTACVERSIPRPDGIRAVRNQALHIVEEGEYGRPSPRVLHGIRQMARWISQIPA